MHTFKVLFTVTYNHKVRFYVSRYYEQPTRDSKYSIFSG